MPMLNGVEVASVLAGAMPDLPIVIYTMYSEMLGLSLATAVGAKAVISKADGIGKLLECMGSLLERKAQGASPEANAANTPSGTPPSTPLKPPSATK
jgi:DNA-binding NarL/FixJ family response regulator